MGFYHGLYGTELLKEIQDKECNFYYEDNNPDDSPECQILYGVFTNLTARINVYDVYRRCFSSGANMTHNLQAGPSHG